MTFEGTVLPYDLMEIVDGFFIRFIMFYIMMIKLYSIIFGAVLILAQT
jgi:hypothetical protein